MLSRMVYRMLEFYLTIRCVGHNWYQEGRFQVHCSRVWLTTGGLCTRFDCTCIVWIFSSSTYSFPTNKTCIGLQIKHSTVTNIKHFINCYTTHTKKCPVFFYHIASPSLQISNTYSNTHFLMTFLCGIKRLG
jgi:hypothetical protein